MAQQTNINGTRYSFTDITVDGETAPAYGGVAFSFPKGVVQSCTWEGAQDAGIVQGNRITMVGRTNGMGVGTGSLELLVSEADDWLRTITGGGAIPVMSVYFNLRFVYSVNAGVDVRTDTVNGIKITRVGSANQIGNNASTRTFDLSIAQVYENGYLLFGDPASL